MILYIVFGSVLGFGFLTGVIALILHRCRKRSTPSTLNQNLELNGYSRGNKSRRGGNFYGNQQPEYIPNESGVVNDDFPENFRSSFLPEWKSLSTIDMSDVVHEEPVDTTKLKDNVFLTYGKADSEDGNGLGRNNQALSHEDIDTV